MSEQWQNLVGLVIIVGMGTGIIWSFDVSFMAPVVGPRNYWRKRGGPFILGSVLPTDALLGAAIWFYADAPATAAWHWLAVGAGVAAWVAFSGIRRAIVRWHCSRHGHAPPALRWRLTAREFWQGIRQAPRGRVIVLGLVCLWALACIVGTLLTFVIKR